MTPRQLLCTFLAKWPRYTAGEGSSERKNERERETAQVIEGFYTFVTLQWNLMYTLNK